jgi:UDPglucose--hexose-1-phosphate uridylyltransferase
VVVYTPRHEGSLGELSHGEMRNLVEVWADRYAELSALPDAAYVFIFENRGAEIGVTLTHPHGQIYALPFVPPRVAREQAMAAAHASAAGGCLQCAIAGTERRSARLLGEEGGVVAYVPFAARVPFEVHVAPAAHRASLLDLSDEEREGMAGLLPAVQRALDAAWRGPMPYTMSVHQRACDGVERAGDHLHVEFVPMGRAAGRLKYLAGVETGAGTYLNDAVPEEKAAELREALARHGR